MKELTAILPLEHRIWLIRGQRVMLDSDLATVYGVPTKRLNEQVRRNRHRFPDNDEYRIMPRAAPSASPPTRGHVASSVTLSA
ncbi:MAG: ORF6N domain-containing protein [Elusimicrobiota bacterium]